MKRILVTAYAVNPYKGSEEGMGWNFIVQIARFYKVIAVTRVNNGPSIERYWDEHPELKPVRDRIQFLYYDWPGWLRFWKKGPLLSLIYYYGWQLTSALWILRQNIAADLVHNINFHNDWTPSFLWLSGKPFVWGPIGHHPSLPQNCLKEYGLKAWFKDRILWSLKKAFWTVDPFLAITKRRAAHIFCMNPAAAQVLRLPSHRYSIMPSVASNTVLLAAGNNSNCFRVLSVGRFVPLKAFTVTVKAFAHFYHRLPLEKQNGAELLLIGSGPEEALIHRLIEQEKIKHCTRIISWSSKAVVDDAYRKASVFLFPSHEGAGMVVAEAMSYGLPVICWENEGPGLLVHPESLLRIQQSDSKTGINKMAYRLEILYQCPAFYQYERQLALKRFETDFRWSLRGDQLHQVYQNILKTTTSYEQPSFATSDCHSS